MQPHESDGYRADVARLRQALRTIERRHDARAKASVGDDIADDVVCCCDDCVTIESALAETGSDDGS